MGWLIFAMFVGAIVAAFALANNNIPVSFTTGAMMPHSVVQVQVVDGKAYWNAYVYNNGFVFCGQYRFPNWAETALLKSGADPQKIAWV